MVVESQVAIILLGHGSRVKDAGEQMEAVARSLHRKYGFEVVKTCYLSRLGPHFPEVLQEVVESGAKEVITIPYFLHGGMHILLDIPEMMQIEADKYPQVKIILGKNLGFDELLVDLVGKRIRESQHLTDVRSLQLPPRDLYKVPEGQCEFVRMKPEEAEAYRRVHGDDGDDHHHH
jgi:sirohydrochlorin ferrochelatase